MTINVPVPSAKNWKTTVIGLLSLVFAIIQASGAASIQTAFLDPKIQLAVIVAVLGFLAKDNNVTGGTVGQPSTPQAIADSNQAPAIGINAPSGPPAVPKPPPAKP